MAAANGNTTYRGPVVVPMITGDAITGYEVKLASLPDNYNREFERQAALQDYANALGLR
jgi:hypothetical protein